MTIRHPPVDRSPGCSTGDRPAAVPPLIAVLTQLADLIAALTDEQYRAKPVEVASSHVGGHVRHCLDHVDALLAGVEQGAVDYDRRQRGTAVETSRAAALDVIARQMRQLLALPEAAESRALLLSGVVSSDAAPVVMSTSVARELAFVLSHTIHHNALVAVLARALGVSVPAHFGYAPSTIAHLEKDRCVR